VRRSGHKIQRRTGVLTVKVNGGSPYPVFLQKIYSPRLPADEMVQDDLVGDGILDLP